MKKIYPTLLLGIGMIPGAYAGSPALSGLMAEASTAEGLTANPAIMTRLEDRSLSVGGLVAWSFGEFEIDDGKTTISGGNPDTSSEPVVVPSIAYVRHINDRWRAGVSLNVPSGFGSDYGGDWAGRYYNDNYSLVYVALTPAIAWRVSDSLSIGAALNLNYTLSSGEVAVDTLVPDRPDGRMESEVDGFGVSTTLSLLWEMNADTRFGLAWTSPSDAELEGDVKLRNPGPVLDALDLGKVDIKVDNTLPQRIVAGIYHEYANGWAASADVLWLDFSEFGTTGIALNGTELAIDSSDIYDDIWGATLGVSRQLDPRTQWKLGTFYLTEPVSDADRSLSMRLDRVWGIGVGATRTLASGNLLDLNLTLINYGEAPVDTGNNLVRGRVAGRNDNPWAVLLGVAWHL